MLPREVQRMLGPLGSITTRTQNLKIGIVMEAPEGQGHDMVQVDLPGGGRETLATEGATVALRRAESVLDAVGDYPKLTELAGLPNLVVVDNPFLDRWVARISTALSFPAILSQFSNIDWVGCPTMLVVCPVVSAITFWVSFHA